MESTCFKTIKLKIFYKMLGAKCEKGTPLPVHSITHDQATIETSRLPVICIFKRSNLIL